MCKKVKILQTIKPAIIFKMLLLISVFAHAQFVQINIDIPATSGVEGISPLLLSKKTNSKSNNDYLSGIAGFKIYANENLDVNVKLDTIGFSNDSPACDIKIAYQNNGTSIIPDNQYFYSDGFTFPLSNSRFLIENMESQPEVLDGWVFINAQVTDSLFLNSSKYKKVNILIKVEYN